jgi:DNA repair exonuclease SbcCD ATPase subunit
MLLHNKGHRNFTSIEVSDNKFETLVAGGSLDVPDELAKKLVKAYPNELTAGNYSKTKDANTLDVKNLKAELKVVSGELTTTKAELEKANSALAETKTALEKVTAEKAELEKANAELTKALDKATAPSTGKKEK